MSVLGECRHNKVKSKSHVYCSVYGCKSFYSTESSISFHWIPKADKIKVMWTNKNGSTELIDRRRAWEIQLRMGKETLKKKIRICSKHFVDEDFFPTPPGVETLKRQLKKNAIPSQNLPKSTVTRPSPKKRTAPKTRHFDKGLAVQAQTVLDPVLELETENLPVIEHDTIFCEPELQREYKDAAVQVTSGDIFTSFFSMIDTQPKLITMTGIPSFILLNKICELFSTNFPDKRTHNLDIKGRIVLVFTKLKQDLSFAVLAVLFKNISVSSCRQIYLSTIPLLSCLLKNCIYWPSNDEIVSNLPNCFKDFPNVKVILDCTEITIQKPKCLSCRIKLYSNYKSNYTLKFMLGVSPGGLITFISKAYGGRASDNVIFKQSNIVQLMNEHDAIMVDKGFQIDDTCNEYNLILIRPPFLRCKKQFSKEEALLSRNIASARVHIERINQRIKTFKIFQNKFQWAHANLANDIMTIISAICNLSKPIFAEDKFIV